MKKLALVIIILCSAQFSFAQINKGAILLEGTISVGGSQAESEFSNGSPVDSESKGFNFAGRPRVGLFVSETFLIGAGITYEFQKTEYEYIDLLDPIFIYTYEQKSNIFSFNPYVRKYISINEKLFVTITGNVLMGFGKREAGTDPDFLAETKISRFEVNLTPGLTYFLSDKWALTASLGSLYYMYSSEKQQDTGLEDEPKNTSHSVGASFQVNTFGIGVQYYLRNKGE